MREVYCDVREGNLVSQSTPYPNHLDWKEVEGTRVSIGSFYQAEFVVTVPESKVASLLVHENCYTKTTLYPISHPVFFKHFYQEVLSSYRLYRRIGELKNFDVNSYPILGDSYKWEWAQYLVHKVFGDYIW